MSTLALSLQFVATSAEPATASALKGCIEDLDTALAELRQLARGLHPAVLTKRGVPAALQALAARSPVPVVLDAALDSRLPPPHEAALYFVAAEALTNAAKYAKASAMEVTLHGDDRRAEIANADDGVGGARAEDGSGLRGLGDRVEALGGRLTVASTRGHGTTVRARVPIAATNAAAFSRSSKALIGAASLCRRAAAAQPAVRVLEANCRLRVLSALGAACRAAYARRGLWRDTQHRGVGAAPRRG